MAADYIAAEKKVPTQAVLDAIKLQANINKGFYLVRSIAGIVLLIMGMISFFVGLCKKRKTDEEIEDEENEEAEK